MQTFALFSKDDVHKLEDRKKLEEILNKNLELFSDDIKEKVQAFLDFIRNPTNSTIEIACADVAKILELLQGRKNRAVIARNQNTYKGEKESILHRSKLNSYLRDEQKTNDFSKIKATLERGANISKWEGKQAIVIAKNDRRVGFGELEIIIDKITKIHIDTFTRIIEIALRDEASGDISGYLQELAEKHHLPLNQSLQNKIAKINERS